MGVMINKKRCDNAEVCPCIDVCPAKAFYYDQKNKTVAVHNELCINCRKCMLTCEAGAVKVFRNEEERCKLKTEYDEDAMTIEKLFQDRYGATIVDEAYALNLDQLKEIIRESNKALLIEFYNENEASCLINSIPIKEVMEHIPKILSYRKIEIKNLDDLETYGIKQLPSLLVLERGIPIFLHEGATLESEKEELFKKLDETSLR